MASEPAEPTTRQDVIDKAAQAITRSAELIAAVVKACKCCASSGYEPGGGAPYPSECAWCDHEPDRHGEKELAKLHGPVSAALSGLLADPAQTTEHHAPSEPAVPLDRGAHAPTEVGETRFHATSVEADTEQGMWYLNVLDEPVHHTTEGAPVNLDWTRDGTLIGVELLGRGEVPRPARCGCADAERLYDELEQAYVSACTERDALSLLLRGMARKLVAYRKWTLGDDVPAVHRLRRELAEAREGGKKVLALAEQFQSERDERQARIDAAFTTCEAASVLISLAGNPSEWAAAEALIADVRAALKGELPARAALVGDQPTAEEPLHWRTEDGGIAAVMCGTCNMLGGHDDDCPRLSGEALRAVEEADDAAGDLP